MNLKVYGEGTFRTIQLHKDFFLPTKVRVGKVQKSITPSEKAEQIGNDIYGRKYKGHVLEENGEVISNTLENRGVNKPYSDTGLKNSKSKVPSTVSFIFSKLPASQDKVK